MASLNALAPPPPFSPSSAPAGGAGAGGAARYTAYGWRLVLLLLYALSSLTNAFMWIQFAPVVAVVQARFAVSAAAVNWLSLVFLLLYLPGTLLAVLLMERWGLRATLVAGALLNAAAAWVRWAALAVPAPPAAFAVLLAGQSLAALAQPLLLNLPTRLAGDWFPASERDIGTVVAAMSNPLGNAVGSVVPPIVVTAPADLAPLLLGVAVWATALAAVMWLAARDRPPTPPSAAAAARLRAAAAAAEGGRGEALLGGGDGDSVAPAAGSGAAAVKRLLADFSSLMRNRNFLCLLIAFGIGLGVFNALLTLIAQVLAPCGYDADTAGFASGALLLAGLIGAAVAGVALERTRAYTPILKGAMVLLAGATVLMLVSLRPGMPAFPIAAFGAAGLFVLPVLPITLENAVEATWPIPEDNSAGLLMLAGQLAGIVFIFVLPALLAMPPSSDCSSIFTPAAAVILGSLLVAGVAVLFVRKDYRRQAAEADHAQETQQVEHAAVVSLLAAEAAADWAPPAR